MVKEEGQPIERREGNETWDKVARKEERGQRGGTGGKVNQVTGAGGLWKVVLGWLGLGEGLSTSDRGARGG